MVFRLIYTSFAAPGLSDIDFRMIAMHSAIWNKEHHIAGLLLYAEGRIIQVLEGPKDSIERLYARIAEDTRHVKVKLLTARDVESAHFSEWSMGYRTVDKDDNLDFIFDLTRDTLNSKLPENLTPDVREILSEFTSKTEI